MCSGVVPTRNQVSSIGYTDQMPPALTLEAVSLVPRESVCVWLHLQTQHGPMRLVLQGLNLRELLQVSAPGNNAPLACHSMPRCSPHTHPSRTQGAGVERGKQALRLQG